MTIEKAFLELYGASSRKYARIVKKNTGFGAYVIDGEVSDQGGISCNGDDYKEMQNLCITKELSDKIRQPSLFFFFSKSSTLVINFASAHPAGLSSSPMAMGGIFSPVECILDETAPTDTTTMCGEIPYNGKVMYVVIPGWHRGIVSNNVSADINNLPMEAVDLSKYSYDIDSKTATKTVTSNQTGWAFGGTTAQAKKYKMTDEYIYKYTEDSSKILHLSSTTGQVQHDNSFASADKESVYYSAQMNMNGDPHPLGQFSSSSNIDSGLFITATDIVTDYLTKDNVASEFYALYPYIQMGISKIYEINDTFTNTTLLTDKNAYVSPKGTLVSNNEYDHKGIYVATSDISGKYYLIKTPTTPCTTYSGKSQAYKVKTDGDYIVATSKSTAKTHNQADFMHNPYSAYQNDQLACAGRLVSIVDDNNNKPLAESMHVGLNFRCVVRQAGDLYCNLMVLYDDGSSEISAELTSSIKRNSQNYRIKHSNVPLDISKDGLNVKFSSAVIGRSYENATDIFKNSLSDNVTGFVDNSFAVPENTGTKKIIALGIIYSSRFFGQIGVSENAGNPINKESDVLLLSNIRLPKVPPFKIPADAKDYDLDHPDNRVFLIPQFSLDNSKNTCVNLNTQTPYTNSNLFFENVLNPALTNIDETSANPTPIPSPKVNELIMLEYPTKALTIFDGEAGSTKNTRFFNITGGRIVSAKAWVFDGIDYSLLRRSVPDVKSANNLSNPVTIGSSIRLFDGTTWLYEKFYAGFLFSFKRSGGFSPYMYKITAVFEDDSIESITVNTDNYTTSSYFPRNYVVKFNLFAGGKELKVVDQTTYNAGFWYPSGQRPRTSRDAMQSVAETTTLTQFTVGSSAFTEKTKRIKKLAVHFDNIANADRTYVGKPDAFDIQHTAIFLFLKNK